MEEVGERHEERGQGVNDARHLGAVGGGTLDERAPGVDGKGREPRERESDDDRPSVARAERAREVPEDEGRPQEERHVTRDEVGNEHALERARERPLVGGATHHVKRRDDDDAEDDRKRGVETPLSPGQDPHVSFLSLLGREAARSLSGL